MKRKTFFSVSEPVIVSVAELIAESAEEQLADGGLILTRELHELSGIHREISLLEADEVPEELENRLRELVKSSGYLVSDDDESGATEALRRVLGL